MNINSWNHTSSPASAAAQSTVASLSPGRRNHAIQPPALMTSLNGPQYHQSHSAGASLGFMSSPATSLSSPFSQPPHSAYLPSPGAAQRGNSPMTMRMSSSSYSAPYNPQEWAPMNGDGSPQIAQVTHSQRSHAIRIVQPSHLQHSLESVPSPPPPYTPRTQAPSPSGPTSIPVQPSQHGLSNDTPSGNASWQSTYSVPPPPPPAGNSRSSSRADADRYQSGMDPGYGSSTPEPVVSHYLSATQQQATYSEVSNMRHFDMPLHAPSSKRAASTGALNTATSSGLLNPTYERPSPRNSWEPGMPLPPPPPGPPPAARSRSASTTTSEASSRRALQIPRSRGPPILGTSLGQVPPTPADWVDETVVQRRENDGAQRLRLNTEVSYNAPATLASREREPEPEQESAEPSSSKRASSRGGLFRSLAVKRDSSAKGIRERRIENRHRRQQVSEDLSAVSNNSNPWANALTPTNLVLNGTDNSAGDKTPSGRQKTFPNPLSSARSVKSEEIPSSSRSRTSSGLFSDQSSYGTPKPESIFSQAEVTPTPPFSPDNESPLAKDKQHMLNSKPLSTTSPTSASESKPSLRPGTRLEERPVSHLLHIPNDIVSVLPPLSPRRMSTTQTPSLDSVLHKDNDFLEGGLQRYRAALEKEAAAASESEALKLFMEFLITESQHRRRLYASSFTDAETDVDNTRKKLFTQQEPPQARQGKPTGIKLDTSFTQPNKPPGNMTTRPESMWWNNYKPCLSPIASISIDADEMSSRGRPPSRWWESKTGSSSEGGERISQRSKRESKYMGVPRELREEMQRGYGGPLSVTEEEQYSDQQNFSQGGYGPDEYPPEKVGLHEPDVNTAQYHQYQLEIPQPSQYREPRGPKKMDISRLVTLPPPYPRHHPAVNNSHPDLVVYRTTVRSISDLSEIRATREQYKQQMAQLKQEHETKIRENRKFFTANIQQQIQEGSIKYAEAAEAEAALEAEVQKKQRDIAQSEYDTYQKKVMEPLHLILSDRVSKATERINELSGKLKEDIQHENPDRTQEEGDEKPEILEQLTQLKWLFEAREQLYREIYDLLGESNEKYRAIVTLPYKQSRNEEKLREADAFFVKDSYDRRVQYESEALARMERFMDVVEENVKRGVETHLSAFWDIAPSLLTLVQQVPEDMSNFQIEIPAQEYEENPSYYQFPLQYLYSLLSHAEKSTYQFIESQTNLLCLLHEVRSGVMMTNCRLMAAQRARHGEPEDLVGREMQDMQAREERELTADLKEKVSTVEGQWTEALGSQIQSLRTRVKSHLLAEDGWDETSEQLE
ncbi:hypothetical protein EYB25_007799 [Talaromyces marneffei]|nr:hypothetical protein EYB25_007799 [Talaromyces marneffei]